MKIINQKRKKKKLLKWLLENLQKKGMTAQTLMKLQ